MNSNFAETSIGKRYPQNTVLFDPDSPTKGFFYFRYIDEEVQCLFKDPTEVEAVVVKPEGRNFIVPDSGNASLFALPAGSLIRREAKLWLLLQNGLLLDLEHNKVVDREVPPNWKAVESQVFFGTIPVKKVPKVEIVKEDTEDEPAEADFLNHCNQNALDLLPKAIEAVERFQKLVVRSQTDGEVSGAPEHGGKVNFVVEEVESYELNGVSKTPLQGLQVWVRHGVVTVILVATKDKVIGYQLVEEDFNAGNYDEGAVTLVPDSFANNWELVGMYLPQIGMRCAINGHKLEADRVEGTRFWDWRVKNPRDLYYLGSSSHPMLLRFNRDSKDLWPFIEAYK